MTGSHCWSTIGTLVAFSGTHCCATMGREVTVGTQCCAVMTSDHLSATMAYAMRREEHLWYVSVLRRIHHSNLFNNMVLFYFNFMYEVLRVPVTCIYYCWSLRVQVGVKNSKRLHVNFVRPSIIVQKVLTASITNNRTLVCLVRWKHQNTGKNHKIKIANTVFAGHKSRAVWRVGLGRMVAGIVGSNPAQGMDVCPRISVLWCPV
jgi:hypothetical protein